MLPPLFTLVLAMATTSTAAVKLPLPVLPSNQTALTLIAGQTTRYVALGRGVQNYTCTSGAWTSAGAVAKLYDVSTLPPSCYPNLPAISLAIPVSSLARVSTKSGTRLPSIPAPTAPSGIKSAIAKSFLGDHFFARANGTLFPVFDFQSTKGVGQFVRASKSGSILSPSNPAGNVAWLQLEAVEGALAKTVYRLNTAGGQPPTSCTTAGAALSVQYAAIYWFLA